jgi:Uma2 family endonuclease
MPAATAETQLAEPLLTAEDLWRNGPTTSGELVQGRFIEMPPTGHPHGAVEARIARLLGNFVEERRLGTVMTGEVGIITKRNPDTVRGADIAFISNERLARASAGGYLDVAPELVVEVISPRDRWTEINEKVAEYLACGVDQVWIADPRTENLTCYRTEAVRTYAPGDTLPATEVLPGLSLAVAALFE